jgi:hypothetical protein
MVEEEEEEEEKGKRKLKTILTRWVENFSAVI